MVLVLVLAVGCGPHGFPRPALEARQPAPPAVTGAPDTILPSLPWWWLPEGGPSIDAFSVAHAAYPGDEVPLYVRTVAPTFTVRLLRVGAYGDRNSKLMAAWTHVPAIPQPPCDAGPDGLLDCGWRPTLHLTIGPWPSGVYLLRLTTPDGGRRRCPWWWAAGGPPTTWR